MIGLLFYLCPLCNSEDSLSEKKNTLQCQACRHIFPFKNNRIEFEKSYLSVREFYTLIRERLKLYPSTQSPGSRHSGKAVLRQGIKNIEFHASDGHIFIIEKPLEVDRGSLHINAEGMIFKGEKRQWIFPKEKILGYTTNSKYFEFKLSGQPFFQILFENESPLKYEDLLTLWFTAEGKNHEMLEHQPRIISSQPSQPSLLLPHEKIKNKHNKEKFTFTELLLHLIVGLPITYFLRWRAGLTYQNDELIPEKGPFVLIMNHQSYLDPILISTLLSRRIAFFTKSTSFADRLLQPVFRAYRSLPNRRYEIDPLVIRHGLRNLKKGNCLGIFPEGERTWDGKLLPFKWTSIRFLQSIQVPIVLAKIEGAFNLLPRWSPHLRKGTVQIKIQCCLSLLPDRWTTADLKDMLESYYRDARE